MAGRIALRFLGTSSSPNVTRNYSSILLRLDGEAVLIDCGEGTQRQIMSRHIGGEERLSNLSTIFVTHMHPDHVLGIVPLMLTLMGPSGAAVADYTTTPRLTIYGPFGLRALIRTTLGLCYAGLYGKYTVHELRWPQQGRDGETKDPAGSLIGAVNPQRSLPNLPVATSEIPGKDIVMSESTCTWPSFAELTGVTVSAAPIMHRCPCLGFVFVEKDRHSPLSPAIFDKLDANGPALAEQGIKNPRSLLGKVLKQRESITLPDGTVIDPPPLDVRGRKWTILGDTSDAAGEQFTDPAQGIVPLAIDSDVLVHESTNAALPALLMQTATGVQKAVSTQNETRAKARERGHSTPQVAGEFAGLIRARQLLLNHFSVRYDAPPPWFDGSNLRELDLDGTPTADESSEPSQAQQRSTPVAPMSWPEKCYRTMRVIEDQATLAWKQNYHAGGDPSQALDEAAQAIAAYDGFVYEILSAKHKAEQQQRPQSHPHPRQHPHRPHPLAHTEGHRREGDGKGGGGSRMHRGAPPFAPAQGGSPVDSGSSQRGGWRSGQSHHASRGAHRGGSSAHGDGVDQRRS